MPGDPQQPVPRPPDILPNPVRPPTPEVAPKPDSQPGVPIPGSDVVTNPDSQEIPPTFPPEFPPPPSGVTWGLS
jgi:hypothetical protein